MLHSLDAPSVRANTRQREKSRDCRNALNKSVSSHTCVARDWNFVAVTRTSNLERKVSRGNDNRQQVSQPGGSLRMTELSRSNGLERGMRLLFR